VTASQNEPVTMGLPADEILVTSGLPNHKEEHTDVAQAPEEDETVRSSYHRLFGPVEGEARFRAVFGGESPLKSQAENFNQGEAPPRSRDFPPGPTPLQGWGR
jgi:hypothetical protein